MGLNMCVHVSEYASCWMRVCGLQTSGLCGVGVLYEAHASAWVALYIIFHCVEQKGLENSAGGD